MKGGSLKEWSHDEIKNLVLRVQKDELNAFGELYELFSDKIYRRCAFMLKDNMLAEDAVHDIFIKMLVKIKELSDGQAFEAWFNRLVYNHCIDLLRKSKKVRSVEFVESSEITENLAVIIEKMESEDELSNELRKEINNLTEIDRTILSMHYWEGYGVKEISEFMKIGESAVKMRMKRSRDALKSNLGSRMDLYPSIAILMILELI